MGVVAEVMMGDVGGRQLLNTTEEGLSGCVFYSWLVLEGIKPHSKQMNPVRVEMMGSEFLQGQDKVSVRDSLIPSFSVYNTGVLTHNI